jgi:hypothetical protein
VRRVRTGLHAFSEGHFTVRGHVHIVFLTSEAVMVRNHQAICSGVRSGNLRSDMEPRRASTTSARTAIYSALRMWGLLLKLDVRQNDGGWHSLESTKHGVWNVAADKSIAS